ncbi:MAG: 50S ribosomal protein L5 [Proteobacteria bacterium]|nr:50S ribosomal protein L5 [Pseudomonadota bacterium]MCH9757772.1 50S ribosomal protein L5 [Pseudomonadota bacterium]
MGRLEKIYREDIVPQWMQEHGCKSLLRVPRLKKIVLNMGVGEAINDKKLLQAALADLERISGQKPIITVARKSIAGFKIREDYPIGCKVTLRRRRMYDFFDRLVSLSLPRSRDFRGLPAKSFDGRGNYNFGVREQIIFHEIRYENLDATRGLDIALETTANNDDEARELLTKLGLPLRTA